MGMEKEKMVRLRDRGRKTRAGELAAASRPVGTNMDLVARLGAGRERMAATWWLCRALFLSKLEHSKGSVWVSVNGDSGRCRYGYWFKDLGRMKCPSGQWGRWEVVECISKRFEDADLISVDMRKFTALYRGIWNSQPLTLLSAFSLCQYCWMTAKNQNQMGIWMEQSAALLRCSLWSWSWSSLILLDQTGMINLA